jgi:GWxTD domain-containing protein
MVGNRSREQWWLGAAVLILTPWLACRSVAETPRSGGVVPLADGPTRWLMLPEEQRRSQRLNSMRDAVEFIEEFWRRRDPDLEEPGNEFSRIFYQRVEAADRLYAESDTRGSLTDRGRALVLLGPPSMQRYNQKRVPVWAPGTPGARPTVNTRNLVQESWVYQPADLPPGLVKLLEEEGLGAEIELVFAGESRHTRLVEGEKYLEMAVRATVRR